MTPFLQQVAGHYIGVQHLEDYCFVFPNRRSGQFFTHYLQQLLANGSPTPRLLPRVTTINDLVAELTGTVVASDIEMTFALYEAYCHVLGEKAQELDKFIYWAQLIISDFNDIDRSLADAHEIYRNLEDLHDLSSNYLSPEVKEKLRKIFGDSLSTAFFDTDADASLWRLYDKTSNASGTTGDDVVKREFLTLWNALERIYHEYHAVLKGNGVITPGKQLRTAAEQTGRHPRHRRLVFVGFGVLSAAEVKLFDRFNDEGTADFWWDNAGVERMLKQAPNDPGALLIDGYCKRFDAKPIEPLTDEEAVVKVVSVPSMVGQAKVAFDEVARMHEPGIEPGIETAIVLPDESLLVPLLHSVHDVPLLNVTLGYPLRSSGIVSLMRIVARLHHQASKERGQWAYYREDVGDILSHPLMKTYFPNEVLSLTAHLARTNRFRVPASEFTAMSFSDLFVPAMDSDEGSCETDYLDHLLAFCSLLLDKMSAESAGETRPEDEEDDHDVADGVQVPLQQAFLMMYLDVLHQLKQSLAGCRQPLQRSTVFYLIDRLSSSAIVSFTGEPLQGLQVMGLLETRNLDFSNVVILSMNERIFPRHRSINSFIPNYMRRAHGMSTIEQQEAIVAFNFYRLLNRSRRVTLISDSSTQRLGSSEPSRYITQLEKVYGRRLSHVELEPELNTSSAIPIQVPNTIESRLRQRYSGSTVPGSSDGKYLSASAINKYINCPLMFYLHYIQGLNEENEASDFMDYGTFGNVVHDTLNECYDCEAVHQRHGLVDRDYILAFKRSRLEGTVVRCIKRHYLHVPEDKLANDTAPLRGEAMMLVETISSYVNFVLDHDLKLIEQKGPLTVLECEVMHNIPGLAMGSESFNFTYKPDRIDRLADGTVRIVDYKTGKDETSFTLADGLPDLFDNTRTKRRKAILQLMLYCHAYLTEHPELRSVTPVIYKLASMKDSGVTVKGGKGTRPTQLEFTPGSPVATQFVQRMEAMLKTLYCGDFIQAPEKASACNYCRFIDFCRRLPAVKD